MQEGKILQDEMHGKQKKGKQIAERCDQRGPAGSEKERVMIWPYMTWS